MDTTQIMVIFCLTFATMRLYEVCKRKGNPWLIMWAAPAFSLGYMGLQLVFRYRIDLWGGGVGEGIWLYLMTAAVMTVSIGVLLTVIIVLDRWVGKKSRA